jgi:hypothetical protein
LTVVARIATSTSPGPGSGSGRSAGRSTSGAPNSVTSATRS